MYISVDGTVHPDHIRKDERNFIYQTEINYPVKPWVIRTERRERRCLHQGCTNCNGTGIRKDGRGTCVHMISCPCPMCSPARM